MEDLDYALALQLQEKFQNEEAAFNTNKENQLSPNISSGYSNASSTKDNCKKPGGKIEPTNSLNDPAWEAIDPTPDIFALFGAFNDRFFWGKLSAVEVKWSPQMTSCAGVCSYQGRGGLCSVRLSEPLLKLRPRSDLVNTLLHEMIHAYLFVTANNRDRDGHGPEFHKHMDRINKEAGTKITVYHTFHDEVRLYQQHWWRCDGPCRDRKPFWGYVKRAKNRAPGPNDFWWGNHQAECGGTFQKIKEPENYVNKNKKGKNAPSGANSKSTKPGAQDIRSFFPQPSTSTGSSTNATNIVDLRDLDKSTSSTFNSTAKTNSNIIGFSDLTSPDTKSNVSGRSNANRGKAGGNNSSFGRGHVLGGNKTKGSSNRSGSVAGRGGFIGGGLKNKGSSTLVIQPKTQTKTETKNVDEATKKPDNPLRIDSFQAFKTNGQVLGGPSNERSRSRLLAMYTDRHRERQILPASPTQSTRPSQSPSVDGRRSVDCSSPPQSSVNPLSNFKMRSLAAMSGTAGGESSKPGGNLFQKWLASPSTSDRASDPDFNFRTSVKRRSLSPSSSDKRPSPNKRPLFSDANANFDVMENDMVSCDVNSPKKNRVSQDVDSPKKDTVSCPVCTVKVKRGALSNHLETCSGLTVTSSNSVICESDDEDIFVEKKQNTRSEKPVSKKPARENPVSKKSKVPEYVMSISDDEEKERDDSKSKEPKFVISISDDEDDLDIQTQDDRFNIEEYGQSSTDPEVPCPCCNQLVPNSRINHHLDVCLTEMALKDFT